MAIEKVGQIVAHLIKGNSGRFANTMFYFLRANHGNTCQAEVRRKKDDLGDWQGLQVPCTLQFSERKNLHKN